MVDNASSGKDSRKTIFAAMGIIAVAAILSIFYFGLSGATTGNATLSTENADSRITLQVQIPCPGHAPLITGELKKLPGVQGVKFNFINNFEVSFDSAKTSKEQILALEIFRAYPAKITAETIGNSLNNTVLRG